MRARLLMFLAAMMIPGCGSTLPVDVNQAIENKELPPGVTITLKDGERILAKNATVQGDDIVVREVFDHRKLVPVDPPRVIHRDEIATISETKADVDNGIGIGLFIVLGTVLGAAIVTAINGNLPFN